MGNPMGDREPPTARGPSRIRRLPERGPAGRQPPAGGAEEADPVALWAASGAMALTGRAGQPPLMASQTVPLRLHAVARLITRLTAQLSAPVGLDPLALLGERAAISGLTRAGDRSCGSATRLLPAADGWVAVSLARPADIDLVPAWLELPAPPGGDMWEAVTAALAARPAAAAVRRARLMGLPAARCGESRAPATVLAGTPLPATIQPAAGPQARTAGPRLPYGAVVADLSSLWAGPLCANVLGLAGARVLKVESTRRPDGARSGPAAFFDLMHGGKESVALDLSTARGAADLRDLLAAADVVIEASRPRALEQLGIVAAEVMREGRPKVWLSITGHGRRGEQRDWVAFGDDAAVAGGLVVWDEAGPCFCADAIADPATGLVAAAVCLALLAGPGRWLADVPLAGVAAWLAGAEPGQPAPRAGMARRASPGAPPGPGRGAGAGDGRMPRPGTAADGWVAGRTGPVAVAPPRARAVTRPGPALGADTEAVLGELRAGLLRGGRG